MSAERLAPVVEAYGRQGPRGGNEAAVRQLCELKHELARNGVRFLAVLVKGEIAGWCELRRYPLASEMPDAVAGQVEDVVVLESFRGRGLAGALVCGAVERLRAEGCDPLFVLADDSGTVKDLYARLGFDGCRRTWSFWWPPIG